MKFGPASTLGLLSIASTALASRCSSETFQPPTIPGVEVLGINANEVHNYKRFSLAPATGLAEGKLYNVNFCNITVTYQHLGWNDEVTVNVSLPLSDWNGRIMAVGGGGYSASYGSLYLTQAIGRNFAAIATNSGHRASVLEQNSLEWALLGSDNHSAGNLNLPLLEDWGCKTLGELATFGKAITAQYYGRQPDYSYFNGCSGGGRQGMAIAQRYPKAFDGILAVAPAMYYNTFVPAG